MLRSPPPGLSTNDDYDESEQHRANSTAAAACRAVVSKTGMGLSAALIDNGISVQPRMTPCAPRFFRSSMIATYVRRDPSRMSPKASSL